MKNFLVTFLSLTLILSFAFLNFEAEIVDAADEDITVNLTVDSELALTVSSATVNMAPNMGIDQDSSLGSTSVTVKNTDTDGYTLTLEEADAAPALSSSADTFPDLSTTPAAWSVASGAYAFGFTVSGGDATTGTFGTGDCTASTAGATSFSAAANTNWRGFAGTSAISVADRNTTTTFAGATTNICFAAEQNASFAPSGSYSTVITATATVK
jgi:hypothetical protein